MGEELLVSQTEFTAESSNVSRAETRVSSRSFPFIYVKHASASRQVDLSRKDQGLEQAPPYSDQKTARNGKNDSRNEKILFLAPFLLPVALLHRRIK